MKVAVCTPVYSDPKFDFVYCLFEAIRAAERELGCEVYWRPARGTGIASLRTALAAIALEEGATHHVWIDSDHVFPADAIIRLVRHALPVVGANYLRREADPRPTAARIEGGAAIPVWSTAEIAETTPLERVDTLGLGLCLVNAGVYQGLRQPLFDTEREDSWFFGSLYRAKVPVFVDHVLSLEVGHIAETVLTFPR